MKLFPYAITLLLLGSFWAHAMQREIIITNVTKEVADKLFKDKKLHQAASRGYMWVVQMLIESGMDVNVKDDKNGWTALMYATEKHQHPIVKYLLESGADVNCQSHRGWTALMLAAENANLRAISDLIEADANPNLQSNNQFRTTTALSLAGALGYYNCCKLIVNAMLKQTTSQISSLVWCFENLDPKMFIDIQRPLAERQAMFVRQEIEKIHDINLKQELLDEFFPEKKN